MPLSCKKLESGKAEVELEHKETVGDARLSKEYKKEKKRKLALAKKQKDMGVTI
jgi:hypothetical protein